MKIRNITPNDLPILKDLVGDDFTDICYEYSKLSINDNGEITSFVIITPKTIKDHFGGIIPIDKLCFNSIHYYEGMKYWIRNVLEKHFPNEQYYISGLYLKEGEDYMILREVYLETPRDKVYWCLYDMPNPIQSHFYNFNNDIWIDIPIVD
jgi:hypothetical protein